MRRWLVPAVAWLSLTVPAEAQSLLDQATALAEAAGDEALDPDAPASAGPESPEAPGGEPAEDEPEPVRVYYDDHALHFESEDAHIELSSRVQFRFTHTDPPDDVRLPGTTEPGAGKGSFRIRRAKTTFEGWFWKPELTFELQLNFAEPEPGAAVDRPLEDGYLQWDASKTGAFMVRVGQFKVPLGRQEMTTSNGLQFVERSLLSFEFTRGRDIGVELLGRVAGGKLEYFAGMFNGNAASRLENDNDKYQYNARLSFQPFGPVAYREPDLESGDRPLLALEAEIESNNLHGATNANDLDTTVLGTSLVFKYRGFSLYGQYFDRERKPEQGDSFKSNGYIVQSGYFVVRDHFEVAFRYAGWDPTDRIPGNDRTEIGGGLNYYFLGHALKIQADYRELRDELLDQTTREVRVQTQFMF